MAIPRPETAVAGALSARARVVLPPSVTEMRMPPLSRHHEIRIVPSESGWA